MPEMPTDVSSASASAATVMGGPAPSSATAQGSSALGKDEFLKLLLAQLSQQDPTQPVDNQAFIAQLAQFSSVEQLSGINQQMESLLVAQAGANQLQATSLVGKTVTYKDDHVTVSGGTADVQGHLAGAATNVIATLTDSTGKVVGKIDCGPAAAGNFSFSKLNATDSTGKALANGTYGVQLTAVDSAGKPVTVSAQGSGTVSGVSFANGYAELLIGSLRIKLPDISEVDQPTTGA